MIEKDPDTLLTFPDCHVLGVKGPGESLGPSSYSNHRFKATAILDQL